MASYSLVVCLSVCSFLASSGQDSPDALSLLQTRVELEHRQVPNGQGVPSDHTAPVASRYVAPPPPFPAGPPRSGAKPSASRLMARPHWHNGVAVDDKSMTAEMYAAKLKEKDMELEAKDMHLQALRREIAMLKGQRVEQASAASTSDVAADDESSHIPKAGTAATPAKESPPPMLKQSSGGGLDADAGLQQTLSRMQYWKSGGEAKAPNDKYVLFTTDSGGPNNIRIGWEMTGLVAEATGRTFVLPPPARMYLLDYGVGMTRQPEEVSQDSTTTKVEDLINLAQLKSHLPTLTWDEFTNRTGLDWDSAMAESQSVDEDSVCKLDAYRGVERRILFMTGKSGPGGVGGREGFNCAEWWLRGGPKPAMKSEVTASGWSLLTHGFVWHEDAFDIASKAVNSMGIFEYSALHARYNDFQYKTERQDPNVIFGKKADFFKLGSQLYIASDEPEKIKNLSSMQGIPIATFDDMLQGVLKDEEAQYSPERWFKLLGLVEEIICTYAKVFIGTGHSSFSGHIDRMRLHAQAPVTRIIIHSEDTYGAYNTTTLEDVQADIKEWTASHKSRGVVRSAPLAGDEFFFIGARL